MEGIREGRNRGIVLMDWSLFDSSGGREEVLGLLTDLLLVRIFLGFEMLCIYILVGHC
jgi:hypothetical protein